MYKKKLFINQGMYKTSAQKSSLPTGPVPGDP